jgi:hypothetical protein
MSKHISAGIQADLAKLHPEQRQEIKHVASANGGSSPLGANTPVQAVDMQKKVLPSRQVSRPSPEAPPR